jgi:hypothetical protein
MEAWNRNIAMDVMRAEFPFAVDIPIPPAGLGPALTLILEAAQECRDGAQVWPYSTPADGDTAGERRQWFERIGTVRQSDAERLARRFRAIGARRAR